MEEGCCPASQGFAPDLMTRSTLALLGLNIKVNIAKYVLYWGR